MMRTWNLAFGGIGIITLAMAGCMNGLGAGGPVDTGQGNTLAETVAKAEVVAQEIGNTNGFGGDQFMGYRDHFDQMMGFDTIADLADPTGQTQIQFHNNADVPCTFHLVYAASYMDDLEDQSVDVTVAPGETTVFGVPCAEIVGLGSLENTDAVACDVAGGHIYGNMMAVPGFINADYTCGGQYDMYFGPDVNDVDGDGDTEELIATTGALHAHLGPGGMMGHNHDMMHHG